MAVPTVIVSGVKGGTGKSLVSANLAYHLSEFGPVGIVDADIDSPFIINIMDIKDTISLDEKSKFIPMSISGINHPIKIMSFGALGEFRGKGITQDGSQHRTILRDMITKSAWGPLSYRIVDCPAGSSDEFIETIRLFKNIKGIIAVTQPTTTDALLRVIDITKYHSLPLLGVIENMGGAVSDCCNERVCCSKCLRTFTPFISEESVERVCKKSMVEFLGTIPLNPALGKDWKLGGVDNAIRRAVRRIRT